MNENLNRRLKKSTVLHSALGISFKRGEGGDGGKRGEGERRDQKNWRELELITGANQNKFRESGGNMTSGSRPGAGILRHS